jgi:hypothetical protein
MHEVALDVFGGALHVQLGDSIAIVEEKAISTVRASILITMKLVFKK